jgi:hypothetical protein
MCTTCVCMYASNLSFTAVLTRLARERGAVTVPPPAAAEVDAPASTPAAASDIASPAGIADEGPGLVDMARSWSWSSR